MVSIADFTSAFEKILTPNVEMLKGEIKALHTEIQSVRNSMDELDKRLTIEIRSTHTRIDALSEKLGIIKDVEQMKARLTQLEARH
jgi:predicted RNase H-like nuclease (RuvC/YqgF family)